MVCEELAVLLLVVILVVALEVVQKVLGDGGHREVFGVLCALSRCVVVKLKVRRGGY
jgi:hypothetical protein